MERREEEEEREKKDEEEDEEEEEEEEEGEDIMSKLFSYDLYEALQIVFLRCLTTAEPCHHQPCHTFPGI